MNKIINYLKTIGEFFIILLVFNLIMTIFSYFELLNQSIINIINFIFIILLFIFLGFRIARKTKLKGYLNGLIISFILSLIFIVFSLINNDFNLSSLLYYLILIASSVVGGIFGVNKEKKSV